MFTLMPYKQRESNLFRYLDELENNFFSSSVPGVSQFRCDITDEGDHYLLAAELPGFSKEEISIEHNADALTINASHQSEQEEKDSEGNFLRRERRFGSFSRTFDAAGIDGESSTASYKDGVLTLTLPKAKVETPEVKKIAIE